MAADEPRRKKARTETPAPAPWASSGGDSLGGLYDFLPPPDPTKDSAAKEQAEKNMFTRAKLPPEDKTKVIFLDVDGVLLPSGSVDTVTVDGVTLPSRDVRESDFAMSALGRLRSIVQQTGAIIVLSSEWRRTEQLRSSISAVLRSHDIPVFKEWTPILQPKRELQLKDLVIGWCERRAREMGEWLKKHPEVKGWVALDDLDFSIADAFRVAGTPYVKHRSVHTDHRIGLTDDDAAEAVRLLKYPPPDPQPRRRTMNMGAGESSGLLASTEDSMPDRIRLG
mmetsp:Transcript_17220/g.37070  ORF Transcript_17220/g.37070 Transcript_17220/m.37070 type:complete len:281 (+) Transcript_17220:205-1047(+)|eukprot:CAMPEP_0206470658 /NCGR_PEP_ID=MMETSP0324_2-20121206/31071_1 /ASSEMBLY_ACC=CAM_ASM_000836 /TAXON_ID=2866 /ORGANISM="Crypthecodinium cohnii, Strain Seligo" /LENGTH=280 /DNA_ID=CAMNT_0053944779 /DNA_START=193 /DNA_END=1035 /DNA_ORIENTATION=+